LHSCSVAGHRNGLAGTGVDEVVDSIRSLPTVTRQGCKISFFSVVVADVLHSCSVAGHRNSLAGMGVDEVDLYPKSKFRPTFERYCNIRYKI
jgi:hypothetical protein